jgi:hypothetical protein
MKMRTLLKRVPCRSGVAGTVRDRPDARQLVGRITLSDRKKFQENALRAADLAPIPAGREGRESIADHTGVCAQPLHSGLHYGTGLCRRWYS